MRGIVIAAAVLVAAPALAQTSDRLSHTIDVTGHGRVSTPPDTANIHYWVRGEGTTPDEASRAMADAQKEVENGLEGLLGPGTKITNSNLVVIEVRDPQCKVDRNQPMLSEGACAIVGYLATAQSDVETPRIDKAGTAVGLASRLGARDARLEAYELRNTAEARRAAMANAVKDARDQAQVFAAAAGGHLGRVLNIRYGSYNAVPITVTGMLPRVPSPPPPPPAPPPVEIDIKPRPQETTADVSVSFELLP